MIACSSGMIGEYLMCCEYITFIGKVIPISILLYLFLASDISALSQPVKAPICFSKACFEFAKFDS